MPIRYVNRMIKEKTGKDFVCDRCRTRYRNMDAAHVMHHTFGYETAYDGNSIEIVLCEPCLLRLAFEWSVPMTEHQNTKRKNKNENKNPSICDDDTVRALVQHHPVHPGEFLLEVYLKPAHTNIAAAAKLIGVDQSWMRGFVSAKNKVTRTIANKLANLYGGTPMSWLAMQDHFDAPIKRLKGVIPSPPKVVTLREMDKAIRKSAAKAARTK